MERSDISYKYEFPPEADQPLAETPNPKDFQQVLAWVYNG